MAGYSVLSSYTVRRDSLEKLGDKIIFSFGGEFRDIASDKHIYILKDNDPGQILAAFENINCSDVGYWKLDGTIIVSGGENLRCFSDYKNHQMGSPFRSLICDYKDLAGVPFGSDFTLDLSCQDLGGASGNVRLHAGWWKFLPAMVQG